MRYRNPVAIASVLSILGFGLVSTGSSLAGAAAGGVAAVCTPSSAVGVAHCNAIQLLNPADWHGQHATPAANKGKGPGGGGGGGGGGGPTGGYLPKDLQQAYNLPSTTTFASGTAPTIAIVDAYNDPYAFNDVNTYRSQFSIPPLTICPAGTTGSSGKPCFAQVNQSGGSSLPRSNTSWSEEISLDLDMVSAICPNCNILLVEASSASMNNLAAAAKYAGGVPGVVAVSNSYGASEFSSETGFDTYYSHSKVVYTVSAGDSGYGAEYPAASKNVVAVGGTSLPSSLDPTAQSVWSGTGSGCSADETQPSWQSADSASCANRIVGDVAAVADPNTGVAVYDTYGTSANWLVFGGTSVASPIIASVFALANNTAYFGPTAASLLYNSSTSTLTPLTKITSGSNGSCGTYLCNAAKSVTSTGYNGPTGNGTPYGIGAF